MDDLKYIGYSLLAVLLCVPLIVVVVLGIITHPFVILYEWACEKIRGAENEN